MQDLRRPLSHKDLLRSAVLGSHASGESCEWVNVLLRSLIRQYLYSESGKEVIAAWFQKKSAFHLPEFIVR